MSTVTRAIWPRLQRGMTLLELMLAMALSTLLVVGLIQVVSAASASARLQEHQAQIQERARVAMIKLAGAVRASGFNPAPWSEAFQPTGLGGGSVNNFSKTSDRLALSDWSDLNCFNARNPVEDGNGNPMFFIREFRFDLSSDRNLTQQCRYGPSSAEMTTQIRRQGLIPGIESFQVLFGQDSDRDGNIEQWVVAGQWHDAADILGVKIGLLIASSGSVTNPQSHDHRILDTKVKSPADGKLRKAIQFTSAFRGRAG